MNEREEEAGEASDNDPPLGQCMGSPSVCTFSEPPPPLLFPPPNRGELVWELKEARVGTLGVECCRDGRKTKELDALLVLEGV